MARTVDTRVKLLQGLSKAPPWVDRSHPSLLVHEELTRAIRHESAAAVCFW